MLLSLPCCCCQSTVRSLGVKMSDMQVAVQHDKTYPVNKLRENLKGNRAIVILRNINISFAASMFYPQ